MNLSSSQHEQLTNLLGARSSDGDQGSIGIRVIDSDASGTISEGDTALFSVGDADSVSQQSKTLSAEDIAEINNATVTAEPPLLVPHNRITAELKAHLDQIPGFTDTAVFDTGNDGRLNVGDTIDTDVNDPNSGKYIVTLEDELSNSINGVSLEPVVPRIPLSAEQQAELSAIFNPPGGTGVYVRDRDGCGTFSAGDTIIPHHSTDAEYDLTDDDIATNTLFGQPFDYGLS